ncbi:T9SS type A sorting domain-containing protein [candidate division KSB1 bacterium]|nr:T9SS type A sorting domain-containing protein [candidate division KSB1 bacterium]
MNRTGYLIFLVMIILTNVYLFGQNDENCFLDDFEPKTAEMPQSVDAVKPTDPASVIVTIQDDTLGKISKYVFGNAIAAWAGAHDNPKLVEGIKFLAPTLIRFPGGSWSNGYFWNGLTSDLPDSIYDGTTYNQTTKTAKKNKFWGQTGKGGWQTTPDQYYALRKKTDVAEGLITVNYGYARYGLSDDPVAQAAHYAADWVRYDNGRTKFWEIGNENGGPWEYGWMIDTTLNKDGQPQIITGELYGTHFKVFADSMRKAADEIGATIYIGGQVVIDGPTSWNFVDRTWNEGFFREVGNAADFYVIHNYFGSTFTVKSLFNIAVTEPKRDINYLKQDFIKYNAYPKPIALTEYNMGLGASAVQATSFINGVQAVILISEMIKNNFGLAARWLLISGEATMFYGGSDSKFLNHPHADFYYLTYLQNIFGDHVISTESSDRDILCYASTFSSGETGVVVVNKGTENQIVGIDIQSIGVGQNYYIYSFAGGTDSGDFSPNVYINGYGPNTNQWGPYEELFDIPADSYPIENEIKFASPAKSVQMIMIEDGDKYVLVTDETSSMIQSYKLYQNYPNPFNPSTCIDYQLPANEFVTLKVLDVLGKEVETLVNEQQNAGHYSVQFNASTLPSGVYFYRIEAGTYHDTKKLLLFK